MILSDISNALIAQLAGLTVPQDAGNKVVQVAVGMSGPEYLKRDYPRISLLLLDMLPAHDRTDRMGDHYARTQSPPYTATYKKSPKAFDLMYQIDAWAHFQSHEDLMIGHILQRTSRDQYLSIKPTTLAVDAVADDPSITVTDGSIFAAGDFLVLDDRADPAGTQIREAFVVASVTGNVLGLDEPLVNGFLASAAVYEARLDMHHTTTPVELSEDGGKPYLRRAFTVSVWASLDLEPTTTVPFVAPDGVQVSMVVNRTRLNQSGNLGRVSRSP